MIIIEDNKNSIFIKISRAEYKIIKDLLIED